MEQPEQMTHKAMQWLTRVGAASIKRRALDEQISLDVAHARDEGASWRMIGVALGTTTQAAWERYKPTTAARGIPGQDTLFTSGLGPE